MNHLGRKCFHLLGGLALLSLYFILGRTVALVAYGTLAVLVFVIEVARLKIPAWNGFFYKRFGSFIRNNEQKKMTGTVPYILGVGLSLYAYATPVAATAVCFLAFGDVAATAVGERFGKTKIGNKSLEGTGAFIAAAVAAGFILIAAGMGVPPATVLVGALCAAGVELMPLVVNDNLAIPVLSGAAMELVLWMTR